MQTGVDPTAKLAVTVVGPLSDSAHVFGAGAHPPPVQPVKWLPALADAVSVTVPGENCAWHVNGQLIPAGLLVTVPEPTTPTASTGFGFARKVMLCVEPVPEKIAELHEGRPKSPFVFV